MKFRPFCSDQFKKVCTKIAPSADIHKGTVSLCTIMYISSRCTSILGELGGLAFLLLFFSQLVQKMPTQHR